MTGIGTDGYGPLKMTPGIQIELYRTMRLIRRFEERVVELVNANEIAGVTHEYIGQEAVASGICAALDSSDFITSTHRGHGHLLARGADPRRMMAELLGRETGLNRGRGGSMHIADLSLGILGANGLVAAGVPFALGAVWAARTRGERRVAVAFFGDGGINQGVLHEAMNLCAIWQLPVIFCCENNQYAVTTPISQASRLDVADRARCYGFPVEQVDGMDVGAVFEVASAAVRTARAGGGPRFLECATYRFVGHHTAEKAMKLHYRSDEEVARWTERDPIRTWARRLEADGALNGLDRERVDYDIEDLLDAAVEYARSGPIPEPESALDLVYTDGQNSYFPARGWSNS